MSSGLVALVLPWLALGLEAEALAFLSAPGRSRNRSSKPLSALLKHWLASE